MSRLGMLLVALMVMVGLLLCVPTAEELVLNVTNSVVERDRDDALPSAPRDRWRYEATQGLRGLNTGGLVDTSKLADQEALIIGGDGSQLSENWVSWVVDISEWSISPDAWLELTYAFSSHEQAIGFDMPGMMVRINNQLSFEDSISRYHCEDQPCMTGWRTQLMNFKQSGDSLEIKIYGGDSGDDQQPTQVWVKSVALVAPPSFLPPAPDVSHAQVVYEKELATIRYLTDDRWSTPLITTSAGQSITPITIQEGNILVRPLYPQQPLVLQLKDAFGQTSPAVALTPA